MAEHAPVQEDHERQPRGTLSIRTLCMPADTNQNGDIFGGWLLGQMDIAGGDPHGRRARADPWLSGDSG
jgi:acyl-CoA hydrolase